MRKSFNTITEDEKMKVYNHMKKVLEDTESNKKLLEDYKEGTITLSGLEYLFNELKKLL